MLWIFAVPIVVVSAIMWTLRRQHPTLNLIFLPLHILLLFTPFVGGGYLPGMEHLPPSVNQLPLYNLVLQMGLPQDFIYFPFCWILSAVLLAVPTPKQ